MLFAGTQQTVETESRTATEKIILKVKQLYDASPEQFADHPKDLNEITPGCDGHLPGHAEEKLAISFVYPAEQPTKFCHEPCFLSSPSRQWSFDGLVFRNGMRAVTLIEESVEWNFKSTAHFFQCVDTWRNVPGFHTRDVGALQSSTFLDICL